MTERSDAPAARARVLRDQPVDVEAVEKATDLTVVERASGPAPCVRRGRWLSRVRPKEPSAAVVGHTLASAHWPSISAARSAQGWPLGARSCRIWDRRSLSLSLVCPA